MTTCGSGRGGTGNPPHSAAKEPAWTARDLEEHKGRWHIMRTCAWEGNFRRLSVRYERLVFVCAAFFTVACTLSA